MHKIGTILPNRQTLVCLEAQIPAGPWKALAKDLAAFHQATSLLAFCFPTARGLIDSQAKNQNPAGYSEQKRKQREGFW